MSKLRLLSKEEVDTLKAKERLQEVKEGAKLAQSVDELRKLATEEKNRITVWRDATLETIKQEVASQIQTRDELTKQNSSLREENHSLRKPVGKEWTYLLNHEKKAFEESVAALTLKEKEIAQERKTLDFTTQQIALEKKHSEEERQKTQELLVEATQLRESAKEELAEGRNLAQSILMAAELREKEVLDREIKVAHREKDAQSRESWLFSRETELEDKEKNLISRYRDLEQAAERIRKGKL